MKEDSQKDKWWRQIFDQGYIDTYIDITTPEITKSQVEFIKSIVPARSRILDLGCGYGRHSIPLAKNGYDMTCLDYSWYLLEIARKKSVKEKIKIEFIEKDMREPLGETEKFGAVISMFTSFGYFSDSNDDKRVLINIYDVLKPGGVLILDLNNAFRTIARLVRDGAYNPDTGLIEHEDTNTLSNGLLVKTIHKLDLIDQRLQLSRKWEDKNKKYRQYDSYFTLYTPREIKEFLKEARFQTIQFFGDFDKSNYIFRSPRLIVLSIKQKP